MNPFRYIILRYITSDRMKEVLPLLSVVQLKNWSRNDDDGALVLMALV